MNTTYSFPALFFYMKKRVLGSWCWVLVYPAFSIFAVAGVLQPRIFFYEKVAFKSASAEPLPRWAIGTGQSSCLQIRSGPIARRGRGGIMPFDSASTTLSSLCPTGHVGLYEKVASRFTSAESPPSMGNRNTGQLSNGIQCKRNGTVLIPIFHQCNGTWFSIMIPPRIGGHPLLPQLFEHLKSI